jgi:glycosyltransferase involved in cell wall biosynthesis
MIRKVCIFAPFYSFAGRSMMNYYEKIIPRQVQLYLFCRTEDKLKFNLSRTTIVPYREGKFGVRKPLRKFCKQKGIDVLTNLSRREKVAMLMIYSTIFTKTKVLFYDHGNPKKKNLLVLFFLQFFLDRLLFCSPDITAKAKKFLFFSRHKIFYLPTSLDTNFFSPKNKLSTRKTLGLNAHEKILIYSGRVSYMKGSDFLLQIIKRNPDKLFILAGEILDKNYKKDELSNVLLTGNIPQGELLEYYRSSDVCLFFSRSEGMSLALREAMSVGTVSIISNIESNRNLDLAIKVPFDAKSIQGEIESYFSKTKQERTLLSKKTREYIVGNFSEEALRKNHLKYFLEF